MAPYQISKLNFKKIFNSYFKSQKSCLNTLDQIIIVSIKNPRVKRVIIFHISVVRLKFKSHYIRYRILVR